jgi:hypothetical protein
MPKKVIPIKYTDRDYQSIRESLIEHVRRYYPNTFQDFSEGSFGSIMLDTVSYVGDVLSFYLDYQANESFLDTANEYENIIKLGRQLGYRPDFNSSSYGTVAMYVVVPANNTGTAPDMDYAPVVRRGSLLGSSAGSFMLDEDVDFAATNSEIRVAQVDPDTGIPQTYAIKTYGRVVSGNIFEEIIPVGTYQRFRNIDLRTLNVAEILEVLDDQGNEYFEVDYLSQDVIYRDVTNKGDTREETPSILKPFVVPRRFVVGRSQNFTSLQFGTSSDVEVDNENVVRPNYTDPSQVVLKRQGSTYIQDSALDPYKLIISDEFGVAPSDTNLTITLRANDNVTTNAAVGSITSVVNPIVEYTDINILNPIDVGRVSSSLEVFNEEPIVGDANLDSPTELKTKIFDYFAAQNRAVTETDYQALAYAMPSKFGAIKRVRVIRDPDSLKRNLNMYVVSSNNNIFFPTNNTTKENLKTWLLKSKMVNDTIDILDAKIINLSIEYHVVGRLDVPKSDILIDANNALALSYARKADIGEPFFITDVYKILKDIDTIVDVTRVKITQNNGGNYSDVRFSVLENTSADGRYINIPLNCIYEIKFLQDDIKGYVK